MEIVDRAYIGPIFNNTFLATILLQLSQIYRLLRKKES